MHFLSTTALIVPLLPAHSHPLQAENYPLLLADSYPLYAKILIEQGYVLDE
jgi:hypothetical protein